MTFAFEVGEVAKERIEFNFNQLLGRTVIRANGRELQRNVRWFSEPLTETYELELDDPERMRVKIEKRRGYLFASHYQVYVNNHLMQTFQGV